MLNKWTRCNILNEEPYMGSSLLQCRRWQGQQMQIVESSIHGSQTFWCLLTTLVFKLDPDWCYCHGPQSDVKNWQNSAAAVQKENKRVEVLKFWHSRRQVTIFKPYWYFASTYSWQCRTEPEKMQERRQKRGGTVNTNSGQDCSWEESGSGWYLAPSSSSLVWHKSFPYIRTNRIHF